MNVPRYSMLAARLLGRHARASSPPGQASARGLETIERALRRSSRRRLLWRAAAGLAVSAAASAFLWQLPRAGSDDAHRPAVASIDVSPLGHGATLRGPSGDRRLDTTAALREDQSIETPSGGGASVRLATGTRLELSSATTFRSADGARGERFVLALGELSADVAKLRPGQRFVIETPDTEIEVRGTRFRLQVLSQSKACGGGSRTRLGVSEGVVEVRSSAGSERVGAGGSWPADCAPRPAESPPLPERAQAEREGARGEAGLAAAQQGEAAKRGRQEALQRGAQSADGATALARQNDLFAGAVAARRRGDVLAALHAYQDLISQFPSSPLVENAIVERMRLLASTHDGLVRDEARRYLARYPNGFAVEEARRLVDAP